MARPAVIDNQRLLEVARDVFLMRGVSATTAEVANRAGISQASIFKRFKTKQELFLAAMQAERDRQDWVGFFEQRAREVGLQQALADLGTKVIGFFMRVLPLALVTWSNRGEFGLPSELAKGHAGPARVAKPMVAALEREMRAGRLHRHDPWLVARTFFGAMVAYSLVSHLFKGRLGPAFTPREYARGVVGVLWDGLAPRKGGGA